MTESETDGRNIKKKLFFLMKLMTLLRKLIKNQQTCTHIKENLVKNFVAKLYIKQCCVFIALIKINYLK